MDVDRPDKRCDRPDRRGDKPDNRAAPAARTGLKEVLARKSRLFVVSRARGGGCPLDFAAQIAYSHLVFRRRAGASINGIHRATGLGRNAARAALRELAQAGLALHKEGRGWLARMPRGRAEGWFAVRKTKVPRPWHRAFAYFPCWPPVHDARLSLFDAALLALLHSLARGGEVAEGVTAKALGMMLGRHARTVSRALDHLEELRLIKLTRRGGYKPWSDVALRPLPEAAVSWFRYRTDEVEAIPAAEEEAGTPVQKAPGIQGAERQQGVRADVADIGGWLETLRQAGIPEKLVGEARARVSEIRRRGGDAQAWTLYEILDEADSVHRVSGDLPHCGHLLLRKLDDRVARLRKEEEKWERQMGNVDAEIARQREAMEPLDGIELHRKVPCPRCREETDCGLNGRERRDAELSPEALSLVGEIRARLTGVNAAVVAVECSGRCARCKEDSQGVGWARLHFRDTYFWRFVPLPERWRKPEAEGKVPPGEQTGARVSIEEDVSDDAFLEGMDR